VSFDVDGIAAYVFGAVSPSEVMGASRLIEAFCEHAEVLANRHGGRAVFVGGGSGLLEVPEGAAAALKRALRSDLADRTKGAATCTVVDMPAGAAFGGCWAALTARMARAKRERGLRRQLATVVAGGVPPDRVCGSCGREPGDAGTRNDRPIGHQCAARLDAAVDAVELAGHRVRVTRNLEEMMARSGEGDRDLLATVYLDADGLGARLQGLGDAAQLGAFAAALRSGVQEAVAATVERCRLDGRVVLPVVGGDDVVVICEAGRSVEVLEALWEQLDTALAGVGGREPLRFSAGVAIGPYRAPLRIHFDLAKRALRGAKAASKRQASAGGGGGGDGGEAHVEIRSFAPLAGHDVNEPIFGGPLARRALGDLRTLVAKVRSLPGAQVAGLRRDLEEPVPVVRTLHLDYRAARHDGVADLRAFAADLADRAVVPVEGLLKGALDLTPVVGPR
jgi:hypothetical protein